MGILDDAIREHLELKRQHGAASGDIERLEKEAFGPPTRPGDPEFAGEEGGVEVVERPQPGESAESGARAAAYDWFTDEEAEAETRVEPQVESPAERARTEHPELGDTVAHPAPGPTEEPEHEEGAVDGAGLDEPEIAAAEDEPEQPPEAPERAIFDADSEEFDFGDLDEEEAEPPRPPGERDDLSLELPEDSAAEHELPPASGPGPVLIDEDDPDQPPAPMRRQGEGGGEGAEEGAEEGEDLLEETPDFLQDAPEGERLWFERGEPRDFDFDDDKD